MDDFRGERGKRISDILYIHIYVCVYVYMHILYNLCYKVYTYMLQCRYTVYYIL